MSVSLAGRLRAALAGRYAVERELGRGGMAVVYLARDVKHDRLVAVKVLRPEVSTALGPQRFLQEIAVAARLVHPHIVPLHDSGEADGLLYYVMPHVAGETLRARLEREPRLGIPETVSLGREVADALAYAHRQGVIHRDIKPENILLEAGHAVVMDFGIARALSAAGSRITTSGFAIGTPEYMSPEQAAADASVDGRSDLYSLGCVLYEALTGRPPFAGDPRRLMVQHISAPAEAIRSLAPAVPDHVAAAVERALAKAPEDRFGTAADFGAALGGQVSIAPRRRRSWIVPAVAAVVLGAGLWFLETLRSGRAASSLDPAHVAVLYFDDQSDSAWRVPEVADGLTEELIDQLGGVPALRVISAAGVRGWRGTPIVLDTIARAFNAGSLVTGTVIRSGDRLRLTVRLIDTRTRVQLKSQTIDRAWSELLAIRDTMVDDVATMLRVALGQEVRLRHDREEAHDATAWRLVQEARPLGATAADRVRHRDLTGAAAVLRHADSLLMVAAARDPGWLEPLVARARLAYTHALLRWEEGVAGGRVQELRVRDSPVGAAFAAEIGGGVRLANAGLVVHPGAAAALEVRGRLRYTLWSYFGRLQGDTLLTEAERDLRSAILADSSRPVAWFTLSELYRDLGRLDEADAAARAALDADAYLDQAPLIIADLFYSALTLERWDDAKQWCTRGVLRFPGRPNFVDCRLRVLGWSGAGPQDVASAWRELALANRTDSSPVLVPDRRLMVAAVLARSGLADSARSVVRATRASVADPYVQVDMSHAQAYVALLLGDRDEAVRLLRIYLKANPRERPVTAQHPWWRPLRGDARFLALVRDSS